MRKFLRNIFNPSANLSAHANATTTPTKNSFYLIFSSSKLGLIFPWALFLSTFNVNVLKKFQVYIQIIKNKTLKKLTL